MTSKQFLNILTKDKKDTLGRFLRILEGTGSAYCVIGGLAVNAYAEPVVSLDLDVIVSVDQIELVAQAAAGQGFKVKKFEHSVNLASSDSDLRFQIQTDSRYQDFIPRATARTVLGYKMRVAALEDVFQGKIWAYADPSRRLSKRQKDLADIVRLVEAHPDLKRKFPRELKKQLGM